MRHSFIYIISAAAALLAGCQTKTDDSTQAQTESPSNFYPDDAADGQTSVEYEPGPGSGTVDTSAPAAADLMLSDLSTGADGKTYYRGHPFDGTAWMAQDRVISLTYADGTPVHYTAYHISGVKAAEITTSGQLKACFDAAGRPITADDFISKYASLCDYIHAALQ